MKRLYCYSCGERLLNSEVALNLKLRGRSVGLFFCAACLAERMDTTADELQELTRYFTENGCELFSRHYVDEE